MDSALQAALESFDRDEVRGEHVVRAERAIPLDRVIALFRRIDPTFDPFFGPPAKTDALERLELAADLDGIMGDSAWGLPVDAVADAYVLADEPDRAFELRLRALSRTPSWDSVLAARQLARVARDLRARGRDDDAALLDQRAARLDPTTSSEVRSLDDLAPLDDGALVDLLLAEEYAYVLGDNAAKPRRLALACISRGEAGMGRLPLYATRKWQPYLGHVGHALRLGMDDALGDIRTNGRLLAAIEATPSGADAAKLSRKKAANAFTENENSRIPFYAERAASGDWATVRQGLLSWHRKCRLFVGGLLAIHGEPLGTAYVERAAALATVLSRDGYEVGKDGYEVGGDWALPGKVLARRGGDLSVTWWGLQVDSERLARMSFGRGAVQ
jgi:hypothetical protein